ncbi:MAG TPA: HPr family phosphocarrier protein [Spirochaetota bacterium]|jgi:phosphocarrier protein|nr:HPr family phosphocarrier protein [Spirochaetota bacterium]OQA94913.1 MAG: HPr-like protein Crh [Spirochaetes bacterium ADurb.Bin218]HOK03076.1 HPr family phosphocarrier protein [Spirochaetota bacterium]HOK91658.1 HPr family phosphocarrier protein [Spirochaetota bacterium]HON16158.1 HPr family phosphocarrier protein [Spirochaetota bacterium]
MVEKEVIVNSDAGIHARPAMMIVREAMKYPCEVTLIKDNITADAKSIMSVLGLAIISGSKLTIRANGDGEAELVDTLVNLIEKDFKV